MCVRAMPNRGISVVGEQVYLASRDLLHRFVSFGSVACESPGSCDRLISDNK